MSGDGRQGHSLPQGHPPYCHLFKWQHKLLTLFISMHMQGDGVISNGITKYQFQRLHIINNCQKQQKVEYLARKHFTLHAYQPYLLL